MTRITPGTSNVVTDLEDHEPYKAKLTAIDWINSDEKYGGDRRLQLDWQVGDYNIRDWVGLRLGRQQSGQVSKLRALLNALVGKPEATEIAWFDDETLDFSYDGATPYYALKVGAEVILRGATTTKEDGSHRFAVKVYQESKEKPEKAKAAPTPKASSEDDEKPPW